MYTVITGDDENLKFKNTFIKHMDISHKFSYSSAKWVLNLISNKTFYDEKIDVIHICIYLR